ncbi:MAG: class I SAM-dependent methyltransferase [Lentisphaerota bacterium]
MSLTRINLTLALPKIGGAMDAYLREAEDRIADYQESQRGQTPSHFVPSDFLTVFSALSAIRQKGQARGWRFCEWGSGFGVVTGLASMLGFKACGIEIEPDLVDQASQLAADFGLNIEFFCGSFIPSGFTLKGTEMETPPDSRPTPALSRDREQAASTFEEMGLDMKDFDVIYAYPWPGEALRLEQLFDEVAADGALLVTYRGIDDVQVHKKQTVAASRKRNRNR